MQDAALSLALSDEQIDLIRKLDDEYLQKITGLSINRETSLTSLLEVTPEKILGPLRSPHRAAAVAAEMARCSTSFALQQEVYMHLIRTFVLEILTPWQAGKLCAAAYPYLMEFPAVISHILEAAGARQGPTFQPGPMQLDIEASMSLTSPMD